MEAEQPASADAAVVVNASEAGPPAAKAEAAEKPASKAPARSIRAAVPAAKIRLSSKCAPLCPLCSAAVCTFSIQISWCPSPGRVSSLE